MAVLDRRDGYLLLVLGMCALFGCLAAGPLQMGPFPPWLYVPVLLLFAVTADARRRDNPDQPFMALFPVLFVCILTVFCLLTQMPVDLWAFIIPNRFPLIVRAFWVVLVAVFLHPVVERTFYDTFWKGIGQLARRGYWTSKVWITIPIALLALWPLHSRNISPDGHDWIQHSVHAGDWTRYLREPLGTMVFRGMTVLGMWTGGWDPNISIGLTTYLSGIATVALLWWGLEYFQPEKEERFLWLLVPLASCGFTQLFLGNIEVYCLLTVAFVLFLLVALRYLIGCCSLVWVGLAFALLFVTHLSSGWWIPAFLLLPAIRRYGHGASWKGVLDETIELAEWSLLPVTLFVLWLAWFGYSSDPVAMWHYFRGPKVMLVGTDAAMFRSWSEMASIPVMRTLINEYFYLSPIGCGLLLFLLGGRFFPRPDQRTLFLGSLAGPYLIYSIVWRPDRKFPMDWDLFSGLTIPALLFLLSYIAQGIRDRESRFRIIRPLVTFSGSLVILQALYNHFLRTTSYWPIPD